MKLQLSSCASLPTFAALAMAIAMSAVMTAAAQIPLRGTAPVAKASTIPALLLSDIHFDPFADPALVTKLDAAPSTRWTEILATPASPSQKTDLAALNSACPVRAADTSEALWQSSLRAIREQISGPSRPHPAFAVITGDFFAHDFDCKYRFLLPTHTHEQFVAFAANTLRFLYASLDADLQADTGHVPIYTALGNNDTTCGGNKLDPHNDFLAAAAQIIAAQLPLARDDAARESVLRDLASGGFYSMRMAAPMQNTRLIVLDDIFFLTEYSTCSGRKDYSEESVQLDWLTAQLAEARAQHQNVWVVGHIAPGVALYSTYQKRINVCAGNPPWMALGSTRFAQVLATNADIVRLGLFGHTHFDEMALVQPGLGETPPPPGSPIGVPVKFIPSISPINLNKPTFTLASIDPRSSTLVDYTTYEASNPTGTTTTWSKEYTYSATYGVPDFSSASVAHLIAEFHADRSASTAPSQAYLRNFFAGNISFLIAPLWHPYVCAMDHQTGAGYDACVCGSPK
jgi:sphingomyelin phosphodiesterase acid-like 3